MIVIFLLFFVLFVWLHLILGARQAFLFLAPLPVLLYLMPLGTLFGLSLTVLLTPFGVYQAIQAPKGSAERQKTLWGLLLVFLPPLLFFGVLLLDKLL